jgi:hypothetical protein
VEYPRIIHLVDQVPTEHVQVLIGGGNSMEGEVWDYHADRLGGEEIQQICDGVEPFYPASQNRNLKNRERNILLIVQRMRLALPFYGEV